MTPAQIERICDACASWDAATREWRGSVRNRLLWMLLAETGLRLGEALGLQHRDWHTGRGDTPFIEVVDREHPHGVRAKSGYRRLYVSDALDRLYGEYVWLLCEAGADLAAEDFDATYVFVNLDREPRFAPWRPESVYRPGGAAASPAGRAGAASLDPAPAAPHLRYLPWPQPGEGRGARGWPGTCLTSIRNSFVQVATFAT